MSTDNRPILVGMNNPYGADPQYALYPLPRNATGWRIWQMLRLSVPDAAMSDYRDVFDRRNLQTGPWVDSNARPLAQAMRPALRGGTVLLFGAKLRDAFGLDKTPCGSVATQNLASETGFMEPPFTYLHWAPHPSGLNQWYNNPENAIKVATMLGRMYRGERGLLEFR